MDDNGRLVRNYGLFWRKDEVDWKARTKGRLVGLGQRNKNRGQVDFSTQRGIYCLYDETFRLIYVGQAGGSERRLFPRLRSHAHSVLSERWTRFSWFGICAVQWRGKENIGGVIDIADEIQTDKVNILNHLEAILIMAAEPINNRQGGRFGREVTHFRQVPLSKVGQTPNEGDYTDVDEEI